MSVRLKLDVYDPVKTRRILLWCALSCAALSLTLTFYHPPFGVLAVIPPVLYAWDYTKKDKKRDVAWLLRLNDCQVVAVSLDDEAAHVDVWPREEELFVVNKTGQQRTPSQLVNASFRTIALPDPTLELLARTTRWLDSDERINVTINVRKSGEVVFVERINLHDGVWSHSVQQSTTI